MILIFSIFVGAAKTFDSYMEKLPGNIVNGFEGSRSLLSRKKSKKRFNFNIPNADFASDLHLAADISPK